MKKNTKEKVSLPEFIDSLVEITEDDNNVYLADWVIPKGTEKAYSEERRRIIWEMYEIWKTENPSGKCYNKALDSDVVVDKDSASETAAHAFINYKNVIAFYCLDIVLTDAVKVRTSPPQSNRQKKKVKGGFMQIMKARISCFFDVQLIVGITRTKNNYMFSVTELRGDAKK